jgi:hypothetical protein
VVIRTSYLDCDRRDRQLGGAGVAVRVNRLLVEFAELFPRREVDLPSKQGARRQRPLLDLVRRSDEVSIVHEADDMPNRFGVHVAEEVIVVALAVHDMDREPWLSEGLLSGHYSSRPSERFSSRILAEVPLVGSTSNRLSPRPRLRCENSEGISRRCDGKTRVEKEPIPSAGLQSAKATALAGELQRRRVVQNQHVCVLATARRGPRDMRLQDLPERDVIVVQESVERLELPLGRHCLGKASGRIEGKLFADPLKPRAPSLVAEWCVSKLSADVRNHRG